MKLIVGLGNPGPQYAKTRHNVGFMALDALAAQSGGHWKLWGPGSNSEITQITIDGKKAILQKPLTFMNLSGQAVVAAAHFYKIVPENVCVVHDELDLALGDVRLKSGGGDAGHNGLKSVTKCLATSNYARIRIGVGRPPHPAMAPADYVLQPFGHADWTIVDDMVQRALQGISAFAAGPETFLRQMNTLNKRSKD